MRPNTDLTIYTKGVDATTRSETWTISYVSGIFWDESKAANVNRSGLLEADRVTVYIPFSRGELDIRAGDVLVPGTVYEAISSSFTISDLKALYPRSATVRSVDRMDRGSLHLRHWQIGCQ